MKNKDRKNRKFTLEEKQRILSESTKPGETMISVAKKHGLPAHTLYAWSSKLKGKHIRLDKLPPLRKLEDAAKDPTDALRDIICEREQLIGKLAVKIEALEARLSKYE